jgi:hypothetical protein
MVAVYDDETEQMDVAVHRRHAARQKQSSVWIAAIARDYADCRGFTRAFYSTMRSRDSRLAAAR